MTTIRDVAKRAGVAPMTVSRVINDSGYVSDSTRSKVQDAIDELGYIPNMLGPSLHLKQTNTLALVLTDITNPFWTTVARGVEDAAHENGYSIILCNTDESLEKQDQYLTMLMRRRIDGILLAPSHDSTEAVQRIQKQGTALVVLDRSIANAHVDMVRGDSLGGAIQLTRHLMDLGHQKITILAGPRDVSTSVDRVKGFHLALQEGGLTIDDDAVKWGNFSHQSGYEMTRQAFESSIRPTALIATNNFIAIGALRALRELDLRVPEEISVVAYSDIPLGIDPFPFLTVATHDDYDMGYQATKLLLRRLSGEEQVEFQEIIMPAEIIIRQSTAQVPELK